MKRTLSALVAALAVTAFAGTMVASVEPAVAQQKKKTAGEKPLKGVIRYRKIGGYSYKSNDTAGTGALWKFIDPDSTRQGNPSGPFDSGFFFDSGIGPNGGQSPYMN